MKTTAPFLGNERTPSGRMDEIDYLKCVCILLMVVFHLAYIGDKYPYAKLVVYTFHMPVFLLISGYLTHIGKPAREFLRKYLWIFIPYAVMETGYAVASSLLPVRQGLEELSLPAVVEALFVSPVGPYWYLHTLMLCALLYYAVFRLVRGQTITRFILLGLCFYGLARLHLLAFENAAYFLGGCILAQSGVLLNRFFRPSLWAAAPLILLCAVPENLSRGTLAGVLITYLAACLLLRFYPPADAPSPPRQPVHRTPHTGHPALFAYLHHAGQGLPASAGLRPYGHAVPDDSHRPGCGRQPRHRTSYLPVGAFALFFRKIKTTCGLPQRTSTPARCTQHPQTELR